MINNYMTDSLVVGTQLNNYVIQSVLGRGAFGITYLALDQNLEHLVAIKEYLPQELAMRDDDNTVHSLSGEKGELFSYGLESFLREAKTIVKFRHPNIVSVLTLFRKNNTAYMVMEYEKGKTLREYVKNRKDIPQQELLGIFSPINDGLLSVHQCGYIHRDIKPDNIVIREDNTPVLIDFGTARDTLNSNTDDLTQIFTNGYAPFEQCHPTWAKQGPWTDIYSLGATLYFAITGKRIVASQLRMLNDPYEVLATSDYRRVYSTLFLKAVDNALSFQPKERPQCLEEWNEALNLQSEEIIIVDEKNNDITPVVSNENQVDNTVKVSAKSASKVTNKRDSSSKLIVLVVFLVLVSLVPILYYFYSFEGANAVNAIDADNQDVMNKKIVTGKKIEVGKELDATSIHRVKTASLDDAEKRPENIKNTLHLVNEALSKTTLSFTDAVALCHTVNKSMNDDFYKTLREAYLRVLQKTFSLMPKDNLKEEHLEWIKSQKNNISKNKKGEYHINPEFKKMLLKDQYLYGRLTVESPSLVLLVKIAGKSMICTSEKPCKTPIKNKKVRAGEKVINFIHEKKKINIDNAINVHPNQNFILYLK